MRSVVVVARATNIHTNTKTIIPEYSVNARARCSPSPVLVLAESLLVEWIARHHTDDDDKRTRRDCWFLLDPRAVGARIFNCNKPASQPASQPVQI